jgi:hypothetical protein
MKCDHYIQVHVRIIIYTIVNSSVQFSYKDLLHNEHRLELKNHTLKYFEKDKLTTATVHEESKRINKKV